MDPQYHPPHDIVGLTHTVGITRFAGVDPTHNAGCAGAPADGDGRGRARTPESWDALRDVVAFPLLRLNGPLETWIDGSWKPSDLEPLDGTG